MKRKIFEIIEADDRGLAFSKAFDIAIITLITVNVIIVVLETFPLSAAWLELFHYVWVFSAAVFSVEIILRVYTADMLGKYRKLPPAKARLKYFFSPLSLVDLLAVLPFYLAFLPVDLRILRVFRTARIFKILKYHRYIDAFDAIRKVCLQKLNQLLVSVMLLGIVIVVASVLIYHVESEAQPGAFDNAFSAIWWIVAALTNVSAEDIYPVTFLGRALSSLIAILGVGLIAVPTGIISAGFIEHAERRQAERAGTGRADFCPRCGQDLTQIRIAKRRRRS